MSEKQRYRGPDIVEVGDVASLTTAGQEPVRDNPGLEPPDWYDASKHMPDSPGEEPAPASEPAPESPEGQ